MKIWAIACWHNEADIARLNVFHHLGEGIDRLIVIDDGSSDGTRQTLEELSRRHPVDVRSNAGRFRQDEIFTSLAQEAARAGVDWVIPIDADEFWCANEGSLRQVLEQTKAAAVRVPVVNFVQHRSQIVRGGEPALLTMTRTVRARRTPGRESEDMARSGRISFLEYPYPDKWIFRPSEEIRVGWGNHTIDSCLGGVNPDSRIVCLHAPLRAASVLAAKAVFSKSDAELSEYLDVAWHVKRWRSMSQEQLMTSEWAANSYEEKDPRFVVVDRL